MKASTVYAAILLSAVGAAAFACGPKPPPKPMEPQHTETVADAGAEAAAPEPPKSLFERLGKAEGLAKIVDALFKNLQADNKFNKRLAAFKDPKKLEKIKKDLTDQLCVESGGPEAGADCKYEGRFMKDVLGPKTKIKEEEWNAILSDLRNALEENQIKENEQLDLVSAMGKFREDVVTPSAPPKK